MPSYYIKLTPETPPLVYFKSRDYYRVRITASDAVDMPNEVFIHQKTLVDPHTSQQQDEFCAVAGPHDLSEYPANAPTEGQEPPFFRKAVIDVLLPSASLATDFVAEVQAQVCALIAAMRCLDELEAAEPLECGTPPTTTTTTTTSTTTSTTTTTTTAAP